MDAFVLKLQAIKQPIQIRFAQIRFAESEKIPARAFDERSDRDMKSHRALNLKVHRLTTQLHVTIEGSPSFPHEILGHDWV